MDNLKISAAIQTLSNLGYRYNGGLLWKPPLGEPPRAWNGEGWPPVGCECSITLGFAEFDHVKITYMGDGVYCYLNMKNGKEYTGAIYDSTFRPLRTKEQRDRDELITAAIQACPYPGSESTKVDVLALYDAGMLRKDSES